MSMFIFIIGFVAWGYWFIDPEIKFIKWLLTLVNISNNWCEKPELNDNISCGEESLFPKDKDSYFQPGQFVQSVNFFTQKRKKNQNNPEILIYLNNAKLMQEHRKSYTIAVIVPIKQDDQGTAKALLRGAAQIQEDFNKNTAHPGLKVIIVNDDNNPDTVPKLAENLLSKDDIVAVFGHYTSELTKEALPIYQRKKVVVIAPATASRESILNGQKYPENFLFRITPSVKVEIPELIKQLKLAKLTNGEKVAIFYTPSSTYSKSAFEEIRNQLGVNRIIDKDVSVPDFTAFSTLNEVKQQGAKALIFIPDGRVNPNSIKNTLSLIDVNQDQLPMGGLSVLYRTEILNRKNIVKKLLLVIYWHPLTSPNQKVIDRAKQLWGTGYINIQTAMSYDGTLVLTKVLEKLSPIDSWEKQRLNIQKQLNSLEVKEGASGTISFDKVGDRKEDTSQPVHVVLTECNSFGAMFVPIKKQALPCSEVQEPHPQPPPRKR
ncbi:MAG: amino acid ABC transporter substrate-binding protein [Dolichospermum sp. DET50]|nr:amino acid ABC transporter substrate-binding protein [Dolichospermum sp. DET66]MBS3033732.1 amino acid ABC transporter substrate-binding protein [Dolichospermum sp. DET67]MBS3038935.1 amino acid ABC transporter substrate-binding protein [Dolichospermum sp. DET50]QSX66191.1 MAG: amino acid ABC transporter substrate-binding protein [Dolichospermum sp. DET69]